MQKICDLMQVVYIRWLMRVMQVTCLINQWLALRFQLASSTLIYAIPSHIYLSKSCVCVCVYIYCLLFLITKLLVEKFEQILLLLGSWLGRIAKDRGTNIITRRITAEEKPLKLPITRNEQIFCNSITTRTNCGNSPRAECRNVLTVIL